MSHASITFDFFQPFDVVTYLSSQIVFKNHLFQFFANCFFILIGKLRHLEIILNVQFFKYFPCLAASNAIHYSKCNPNWFFICEHMSLKSKHTTKQKYKETFFQTSNYPCLCLWLPLIQITRKRHFLLINLQLLHIFLTEDLTFIHTRNK